MSRSAPRKFTIAGGDTMSDEEFGARAAIAARRVDFMIGSVSSTSMASTEMEPLNR
jgi:hypothetical protein